MNNIEEALAQVNPAGRILLLPHCLRRSESCQAKYNEWGLQCQGCNPECPVYLLSQAALACGYKGICVAPGGRLAVTYVEKIRPEAIVAVACEKELDEGIKAVNELDDEALNINITVIPLLKDGCIDTEVDLEKAVEIIGSGCVSSRIREGV